MATEGVRFDVLASLRLSSFRHLCAKGTSYHGRQYCASPEAGAINILCWSEVCVFSPPRY